VTEVRGSSSANTVTVQVLFCKVFLMQLLSD
jgi:hypothetical protein